jgi:hypothetical protein
MQAPALVNIDQHYSPQFYAELWGVRELVPRVGLSERVIQQIIEDLIVLHGMRIGASRELPRPGYYLCLDEADIEAAVRPLRSSAASLLKRIEALTRPQDR